jgi:hypothetical protein
VLSTNFVADVGLEKKGNQEINLPRQNVMVTHPSTKFDPKKMLNEKCLDENCLH